jgi:quercetin dioxygenase-like cupin family protein
MKMLQLRNARADLHCGVRLPSFAQDHSGEPFMRSIRRHAKALLGATALAFMPPLTAVLAQPAQAPAAQAPGAAAAPARGGRGGGRGGPAETWYINKVDKVVYTPPNRPIWRQADLLKMHAGQNNWSQPILKDDYQEVSYNSAAPGTKFIPRMHNETDTVIFVMKGQVHFTVEGQEPVTATRGGIVNILNDTIYSYDVTGSENALFIILQPRGTRTEYPTADAPPPPVAGTTLNKVSFAHRPGKYTGNNKLYFNLFDAIAKCQPTGGVVDEEHLFVNPLTGFVHPEEYTAKCPPGSPGSVRGGGATTAPSTRTALSGICISACANGGWCRRAPSMAALKRPANSTPWKAMS